MSFKEFLQITTFLIGSALIVLLMFLPMMAEDELADQNQPKPALAQTPLPINSSSFIGTWNLFWDGQHQYIQYVFEPKYVYITNTGYKTKHQWTYVSSTKVLSIQYDTGWLNYSECNKINDDTLQFTRNSYVYELQRGH